MPLPKILDIGFKIDEPKLWAMDIPVEMMNLSELNHNLDIPYLEQEGTNDWNLTPRMLIEHFDTELRHAHQTEQADLRYPIEIYKHKNTWIILDGVHRFTKAVRQGHTSIQVRKISDAIVNQTKKPEQAYRKWKGEE